MGIGAGRAGSCRTLFDDYENADAGPVILENRGGRSQQKRADPKLLIQPIVENAILHGVEQRLGPGTVIVRAQASDQPGYTVVSITDDGPGMDEQTVASLYSSMEKGYAESAKKAASA
ncbi:Predicted signal transduction protein with a C-terminal ATPase domain [Actinobacillus pleuropneumoniae]|nr:Predicted signal transduction protein with a C-terminal ATPase domain [Actinobacillus pleuropneumoniae]